MDLGHDNRDQRNDDALTEGRTAADFGETEAAMEGGGVEPEELVVVSGASRRR